MIRKIRSITLTAAALAAVSQPGSAEREVHWPGLLGPKRNGFVDHFTPPAEWPERLERVWQVDIGEGYGSPIVAGNRVYQHARQGDDEVVWCLDLETGEEKWRESYEVFFTIGQGGQGHGKGPKSSPVIADGRLFTLSITGTLSAWNAESGQPLWRKDFKDRYKKNQPYWGVATSPIVDGGRVVLHIGDDETGELVALDSKTGSQVWSHGKDGTSYSSPLAAEIGGVRQIVEWNHRAIVGVESKTGKFLWEFPFPHVGNNQNMPTPSIHNGCILVGGENRGIRSIEPRFENGAWTVKERWHQEEVALDMSSAVVNDDWLFGFSHYRGGQFFCIEAKTGKVLWKGSGRAGQNRGVSLDPGACGGTHEQRGATDHQSHQRWVSKSPILPRCRGEQVRDMGASRPPAERRAGERQTYAYPLVFLTDRGCSEARHSHASCL